MPAMSTRPIDRRTVLVRSLQASGLALGGSALLAACSSSDTPATPSSAAPSGSTSSSAAPADYGKLAVQLSWIKNAEFAGEYVADSKGYFKDGGFSSVELIAGPTSAEAVVVQGNATVGLSAPAFTAPAILNESAPLKIIGATFQKNPFCILSLAANPIPDAQSMIGKKIGVQDANELIWQAFLKANKITEDQLTRVVVQFDPAPLVQGEVDGFLAYITNEPNSLRERGEDVTTFLFADQNFPLYGETFCVTQDNIDNNREMLKAFLKAEIMGWTEAIADPEAAVALTVDKYGKDLDLDPEAALLEMKSQTELIVSAETKANGIFFMTPEMQADNCASLAEAGFEITPEQLFDNSLLEEVYAENPDLI